MSSYYTLAHMEAERRVALHQEIGRSIRELKERLKDKAGDSGLITAGPSAAGTVIEEDNAAGGFTGGLRVSAEALRVHEKEAGADGGLDLSGLLSSAPKAAGEERSLSHGNMAEASPLLTDELYLEYLALCELLREEPAEMLPSRMEEEVERMTGLLSKRREDEYVMAVIDEVMEELGCHPEEGAVLDHTEGQLYSVDGQPLCDVFVGNDGRGIMFEPVGGERADSLEKRRRLEEGVDKVCSLYSKVEQKALEKGVILSRVYMDPPEVDKMCLRSDIKKTGTEKRHKKAAPKARALG